MALGLFHHLFCPSPFSFLKPSLQTPEQDSVGGLYLPICLGVLDQYEHLLYPDLCTQFAQLLACELCTVVRDKAPWHAKATYYIPPDEVLHLVGCNLRY